MPCQITVTKGRSSVGLIVRTWPGRFLFAFHVVQVIYLASTASDASAPGWKMFNSVRFESFQIETLSGEARNWEDYTVFPAYGVSRKQAIGLSRHICRREPKESMGVRIEFLTGETFEFHKPSCR